MLNGHINDRDAYENPPTMFGVNDVNVSFGDFEPRKIGDEEASADKRATYSSYNQDAPRDQQNITLNLQLGQPSESYFVANETPTPTRLIKNCEEVGLFDDLRDVNPFEEGFRRAVEEQAKGNLASYATAALPDDDSDSLNTPQVYIAESSGVASDVTATPHALQTDAGNVSTNTSKLPNESNCAMAPVVQVNPAVIEVVQPQVITWLMPVAATELPKPSHAAIPVQTVRPFLLPKPASTERMPPKLTPLVIADQPESPLQGLSDKRSPPVVLQPSSASLTPTSQLPIKERLKAILNSNKLRSAESQEKQRHPTPTEQERRKQKQPNEAFMERRRAAASRYRNKMRNEQKEFRQSFDELKAENARLRERVKELEQELDKKNNGGSQSDAAVVAQNKLQIPSTNIHLVINVPSHQSSVIQQATTNLQL